MAWLWEPERMSRPEANPCRAAVTDGVSTVIRDHTMAVRSTQQPAALLAPARLGQHPSHQPWWERTGQRADRDPIPQPLRRWRLDLPCPWHHASSAPSTNTKDADNTTPTRPN